MCNQAVPATFIHYQTNTEIKLFQTMTRPLLVMFDTDSKQVNLFCEALGKRANKAGWNLAGGNIIDIPDTNSNLRNLITEYGSLTKMDIKYSQGPIKDAIKKGPEFNPILAKSSNNTIAGNPVGELLFKLLMTKEVMNTRFTLLLLRENLTNLDSHMTTVNSSIDLFNQYVIQNQEYLKTRDESTSNLMTISFKAYLVESDGNFVCSIMTKKDTYNDGVGLTVDTLMSHTDNKYKILKQQGTWNAMLPKQEQIEMLASTLKKLKDNNLKLSQQVKDGTSTKQQN
eukprot:7618668-Ditylum_brightwellii.AAC.1